MTDLFEREDREAALQEAEIEAFLNGSPEKEVLPGEGTNPDSEKDPELDKDPEQDKDLEQDKQSQSEDDESFDGSEDQDNLDLEPEKENIPGADDKDADGKVKKIPPAGFVEKGALLEARTKLKEAKAEAEALRLEKESFALEIQRITSEKSIEKEPEFTELTESEINELREENPDGYVDYRFALQDHKDKLKVKADHEERMKAVEKASFEHVKEASLEVNEFLATPGIVDTLIDYGIDSGFSKADLVALSQPQTKIVTGDGKTRYLGKAASAFLKHLNTSRTSDRKSIEQDVEAKLRPQLEQEITQKLLGKIKEPYGQQSLDGQGEKRVKKLPDNLTEAQYDALSPADQEAWLMQQ